MSCLCSVKEIGYMSLELKLCGIIMSLVPDGTLNLPNSGLWLKIVEEAFILTVTENKWPDASQRGGLHGCGGTWL